jgi:hypothetical protein
MADLDQISGLLLLGAAPVDSEVVLDLPYRSSMGIRLGEELLVVRVPHTGSIASGPVSSRPDAGGSDGSAGSELRRGGLAMGSIERARDGPPDELESQA